ncbi:restriction endonuclease subunit S [uncultured Prevotella sp.]|uniref:restriction endonuclease subunit S n=1 Tax=uncultured Prevotella sp. TaxID=159272 RepID=UPI0026232867|nr:restriction endonuclease subunit S [uncultured Prevotella sp.]
MNGKQLRNSILQWAIQGKLVPQDSNDEPASVLLEKIRQEKERLIKEKKIKRDKNASIIYRGEDNSYYEKLLATGEVKCIDEEIQFEIPQGWEWERIGNLFETTSGSTPLSRNLDYYKDGCINWVRTTDLNNGILCRAEIQITAKACSDYNLTILPQNSVCIAMYGGAGTIGKHCLLCLDTTINQSVCAIQPNGYCNMDYVHTFIEYQRPYWMEFAAGSRKDPNINQLIIKHCLLPIPPQKEQVRIVEKLSLLNPHIDRFGECQIKLEHINKNILDLLKKSILQEAIQGKLVPQLTEEGTAQDLLEQIKIEKLNLVKGGKLKKSALNDSVIFRGDDNKYYEQIGKKCVDITDEIPFPIPVNWRWVRTRDVFQLNPKNEADDETLAAFIPMEKISAGYKSDFVFDTVKWGSIKKGFTHFANGDVAFAKITPCFQNRKSAIFHGLPNGIGAGTTELKVLRPYGNTIDRWYLLYFLESPYFIDEATFKGTANQQRIVVGYLENKPFPLPPRKEQQRIVEKIEQLMQLLK